MSNLAEWYHRFCEAAGKTWNELTDGDLAILNRGRTMRELAFALKKAITGFDLDAPVRRQWQRVCHNVINATEGMS